MVMHQPSKLCMSVRFRLPAPTEYFREIRELHAIVQRVVQVLARAIAQGNVGGRTALSGRHCPDQILRVRRGWDDTQFPARMLQFYR